MRDGRRWESEDPRPPTATEIAIGEVVDAAATAAAKAAASAVAARVAPIESAPDLVTERVPVATIDVLARKSARSEVALGTPTSLSAFEVPGRSVWPRSVEHDLPTRKIEPAPPLDDDPIPNFRPRPASVWIFGLMALVVGLATGAAVVTRAQVEASGTAAAPLHTTAPAPATETLPPAASASASGPAASASAWRPLTRPARPAGKHR